MAVTPIQKTNVNQSKRADLRRQRHEYGVLIQLSLASIAIRSFGVDLVRILAPTRGSATVTFARHAAMYTAVIEGRLSLTEAASHFARDRRAVAYGVAQIEARRDTDATFDTAMDLVLIEFRRQLDDLRACYRVTGTVVAA